MFVSSPIKFELLHVLLSTTWQLREDAASGQLSFGAAPGKPKKTEKPAKEKTDKQKLETATCHQHVDPYYVLEVRLNNKILVYWHHLRPTTRPTST